MAGSAPQPGNSFGPSDVSVHPSDHKIRFEAVHCSAPIRLM
jgi:hypothetical protein